MENNNINPMPIELDLDEFVKLYAPDPDEVLTPAEKLRRSLIRAHYAALAVVGNGEDGGTCNFDSPVLDYAACDLTKANAEKVIKGVGLDCYDWKPFKSHRENGKLIKAPVYLVIIGFQRGQGNLRTRMSREFCNSLIRDDIEAGMYYQMD